MIRELTYQERISLIDISLGKLREELPKQNDYLANRYLCKIQDLEEEKRRIFDTEWNGLVDEVVQW